MNTVHSLISTASLLALLVVSPTATAADYSAQVRLGEQIYRSGRLASGELLQATVQHDVKVSSDQLICAQCHRPSGFGSSESGRRIPPVTSHTLFSEHIIERRELYASRSEGEGTRPPYDEALLARAIRHGIDSAGRSLAPAMPRFQLPPEDMRALIAYLKTLSTESDPGVSQNELHIATLIGPEVDGARIEAMLALMQAYIDVKNSGTRLEERRAQNTPWQKESSYPAYRRWVLHTWQLQGPPESWPGQLKRLYAQRPVFALVGGVVDGNFQPIADYCNANRLPCLFPSSAHPATNPGFYTMHFTAGKELEAAALATHLNESRSTSEETTPLQQVYREKGTITAATFRRHLQEGTPLQGHLLKGRADENFWQRFEQDSDLILWLDPRDLETLAQRPHLWPRRIFLQSTTQTEALESLPEKLRERIFLLYPYALPKENNGQRLRVKLWLRTKGIDFTAPKVQLDTYFVLTLFNDIMRHLGNYFYRDYAIETIEHMLDSALATSLYPRVSLAPGQRYASKGCYLVRLSGNGDLEPATRWIVPAYN